MSGPVRRTKREIRVPLLSDENAFGDNQTSTSLGALSVVLGVDTIGNVRGHRPVTRHGGHKNPILEGNRAEFKRPEKRFEVRHWCRRERKFVLVEP